MTTSLVLDRVSRASVYGLHGAVSRRRATASVLIVRTAHHRASHPQQLLGALTRRNKYSGERQLAATRALSSQPEPAPPQMPDEPLPAAVGGADTSTLMGLPGSGSDRSSVNNAGSIDTANQVAPGHEAEHSGDIDSAAAGHASAASPGHHAASPRGEAQTSGRGQRQRRMERLRLSLLAALSSLDRGLAANAREAAEVDDLCSLLEGLGGPVVLPSVGAANGGGGGAAADLLAGTWRLVYSSGFNSGSLGGRRPGPPVALFPTILGQVYQRIDPNTAKLDNIVELLFSSGPLDWGLLGLGEQALGRGLSGLSRQLGLELRSEQLPPPLRDLMKGAETQQQQQQKRESPAARLTLRHDYEVTSPATVRIVYEETYGELVGSDLFAQLPRLEAPSLPEPLRPPKFLRSATFEVTFLDETLRITRGDRGELRVYLRDLAADAIVGEVRSSAKAIALDYDD